LTAFAKTLSSPAVWGGQSTERKTDSIIARRMNGIASAAAQSLIHNYSV
jgi:hypothetical protein